MYWVDASSPGEIAEALTGFDGQAKNLGPAGTWKQADCQIAGEPAKCTRVTALVGKGGVLGEGGVPDSVGVLLWGGAAVHGRSVAAWCKYVVRPDARPDLLPSPCDVVFSIVEGREVTPEASK